MYKILNIVSIYYRYFNATDDSPIVGHHNNTNKYYSLLCHSYLGNAETKTISQQRALAPCNITSQNILLQQAWQFDSTAIYIKVFATFHSTPVWY